MTHRQSDGFCALIKSTAPVEAVYLTASEWQPTGIPATCTETQADQRRFALWRQVEFTLRAKTHDHPRSLCVR